MEIRFCSIFKCEFKMISLGTGEKSRHVAAHLSLASLVSKLQVDWETPSGEIRWRVTDNAVLFSFPQIWGNLTTTCWCALTRKMKLRLLETLDSSKNYVEVVLRTELSESGMVIQACNSSTQEARTRWFQDQGLSGLHKETLQLLTF